MPTKRKTTKKKATKRKRTAVATGAIAFSVTGTGKRKAVRARTITQALKSVKASLKKKNGRATVKPVRVKAK